MNRVSGIDRKKEKRYTWTGIPKGEEKENRAEKKKKILEEMTENFPQSLSKTSIYRLKSSVNHEQDNFKEKHPGTS